MYAVTFADMPAPNTVTHCSPPPISVTFCSSMRSSLGHVSSSSSDVTRSMTSSFSSSFSSSAFTHPGAASTLLGSAAPNCGCHTIIRSTMLGCGVTWRRSGVDCSGHRLIRRCWSACTFSSSRKSRLPFLSVTSTDTSTVAPASLRPWSARTSRHSKLADPLVSSWRHVKSCAPKVAPPLPGPTLTSSCATHFSTQLAATLRPMRSQMVTRAGGIGSPFFRLRCRADRMAMAGSPACSCRSCRLLSISTASSRHCSSMRSLALRGSSSFSTPGPKSIVTGTRANGTFCSSSDHFALSGSRPISAPSTLAKLSCRSRGCSWDFEHGKRAAALAPSQARIVSASTSDCP
mmetsp:Transcript_24932/g.64707  ORF Transcript_24932/g.64707 Transcript_24932/m.64707 type:complete len:347 (-) Transcript_24932:72-1112(-)